MALICHVFVPIMGIICLSAMVCPHRVDLPSGRFQVTLREFPLIEPPKEVKNSERHDWNSGVLGILDVSPGEDSTSSSWPEVSRSFRPSQDDSSYFQDSIFFEQLPSLPKYPFSPIHIERRSEAGAVNSGRMYQLQMCTGDYLRIGNDGVVSSVTSRFDLNTYLYFYQCLGPSAFRIKGVRSQRFLAMNDAAMLIGVPEDERDSDCSDWKSVWFERLAHFQLPPLNDITLLTYHVTSPASGLPWYIGFTRSSRPIAWNRQSRATRQQICFIKQAR
ncbi:uncharacterized protein LOC121406434 [Lytechinus variegatus]|uniref:uncharacterized protein LOC121406434 n=1 Tax=Lytechinus variegatus TaxID=7654 RepID=UPI001BB0E65A|nr:uncharacterized protein LOC121406434 [Lytechinus variegatus]